jgi:hypothetical protein
MKRATVMPTNSRADKSALTLKGKDDEADVRRKKLVGFGY